MTVAPGSAPGSRRAGDGGRGAALFSDFDASPGPLKGGRLGPRTRPSPRAPPLTDAPSWAPVADPPYADAAALFATALFATEPLPMPPPPPPQLPSLRALALAHASMPPPPLPKAPSPSSWQSSCLRAAEGSSPSRAPLLRRPTSATARDTDVGLGAGRSALGLTRPHLSMAPEPLDLW
jgi:hypothetical protein